MSILQQVSDKMQTILRPLADQAAVETGMVKRNRKLTGSALTIETLNDIKRIFENGGYLQEGTGKYTTLRRLYDALENP